MTAGAKQPAPRRQSHDPPRPQSTSTSTPKINWGRCRHPENFASLLRQITDSASREISHAVALLRKIVDLEREDDGEVILGAAENGHDDRMSRIVIFLAEHDQ